MNKEAFERFGDVTIEQSIHTVKYADDVVPAKVETVLQCMIDRLGRCSGMEMNVEKTMTMGNSRQPSPIQITIDQKQPENVEYFNSFDNMNNK